MPTCARCHLSKPLGSHLTGHRHHFLDYSAPPCRLLSTTLKTLLCGSRGSAAAASLSLQSDTAGRREGTSKSRPRAVAPLFSGRLLSSALRARWLTPSNPSLVHRCCLCRPPPTLPGWLPGWLAAPFFSENQEAACPTYAQPRIGSGRALGDRRGGVGRAQRGGGRGRAITGVRPWCDRLAAVSVGQPEEGRGEGGQVGRPCTSCTPHPLLRLSLRASPCVVG